MKDREASRKAHARVQKPRDLPHPQEPGHLG